MMSALVSAMGCSSVFAMVRGRLFHYVSDQITFVKKNSGLLANIFNNLKSCGFQIFVNAASHKYLNYFFLYII
jgi:hypothetical protein